MNSVAAVSPFTFEPLAVGIALKNPREETRDNEARNVFSRPEKDLVRRVVSQMNHLKAFFIQPAQLDLAC